MKNNALIICFFTFSWLIAQSSNLGFKRSIVKQNGMQLEIYDFITEGYKSDRVKLKYFSYKAYSRFEKWKSDKDILLVTAGGFVDSPTHFGKPIGLTAEDGEIINKFPDHIMDGVLVIPPAKSAKSLKLINLDFAPDCNSEAYGEGLVNFNPRKCWNHTYPFFKIVQDQQLSIMQSQLLYSNLKPYQENFKNLITGKEFRKRRYLVLASKNNMQHALIVQPSKYCYVMVGAKNIYDYLNFNDYEIEAIVNLDTGSNNILHVSDGNDLINKNPYNETVAAYSFHARIKNSLNLLVFYK